MPDLSCQRGSGRARPGEVLVKGNKWISTCGLHLCIRERCCEAAGPHLGCPHSTWRRPLMPPRSPSLGAVPCKGCCTQLPSPGPTEHSSRCSMELGHQRDSHSPSACGSLWHRSKWVCVEGAEPAPATCPHHWGTAHGGPQSTRCRGKQQCPPLPEGGPASVTGMAAKPRFSCTPLHESLWGMSASPRPAPNLG